VPKFSRRPQVVDADQFFSEDPESDWPVGIRDGERGGYLVEVSANPFLVPIKDGDWIVTEADGTRRVMEPHVFAAEFEAV
jgi:hypothetical protein